MAKPRVHLTRGGDMKELEQIEGQDLTMIEMLNELRTAWTKIGTLETLLQRAQVEADKPCGHLRKIIDANDRGKRLLSDLDHIREKNASLILRNKALLGTLRRIKGTFKVDSEAERAFLLSDESVEDPEAHLEKVNQILRSWGG